jgi:4-diphosphocytidyl-2-C-methyl-D-erythritol kinase
MKLNSPSKINLFLRILNKRPDGYHELASLFQAIDLCDFLHIDRTKADSLTCSNPSLATDSSNLIHKALRLFRAKTSINHPVSIHLEKHIPMQAGLGGGSGNAATTLWGLNQLFGKPATECELAQWAAEIGSDISFFFSHGTAYCTGRGELIRPFPPLPDTSLWIVKPSGGLSTPQVFNKLNTQKLPQRDPNDHLAFFLKGQWQCFNDLEDSAFSLMPELDRLKKQLLASGFSEVVLCGSGSSLFCRGDALMPALPHATTYRTRFIRRQLDAWF